jgi:hypothetical protein
MIESGRNGNMATGALLAAAVGVLALPSAVLAFSTGFEPETQPASLHKDKTQGASDSASSLAAAFPLRSLAQGPQFPFTPAGMSNRTSRSVTVAVRVDAETAKAISLHGPRIAKIEDTGAVAVRISPEAFNLGISRGFQNFAQGLVPTGDTRKGDAITIAGFAASAGKQPDSARFSPRIAIDDRVPTGRAPRTFAADEDRVDLGGSYRLTRNLNVTAGVRYSQERERLRPLTDGNPDNQAVYVGTQFRF